MLRDAQAADQAGEDLPLPLKNSKRETRGDFIQGLGRCSGQVMWGAPKMLVCPFCYPFNRVSAQKEDCNMSSLFVGCSKRKFREPHRGVAGLEANPNQYSWE